MESVTSEIKYFSAEEVCEFTIDFTATNADSLITSKLAENGFAIITNVLNQDELHEAEVAWGQDLFELCDHPCNSESLILEVHTAYEEMKRCVENGEAHLISKLFPGNNLLA